MPRSPSRRRARGSPPCCTTASSSHPVRMGPRTRMCRRRPRRACSEPTHRRDPRGTMNALDVMQAGPVIPVIVIDRLADAVPLARALVAGGVRVLELTLRTPQALAAIERVAAEVEGAIVGAGTITRAED